MRARHIYMLTGQIQGVGFRPFIYREAASCRLTGFVSNTSYGVRIEVQGREEDLLLFSRFSEHLPPLARISSLKRHTAPCIEGENSFRIEESSRGQSRRVLVSPDVAPCPQCLEDMANPENRRFGYAFTNCTGCGPRYTITRSIPYDRPATSMACFPLCAMCAEEYHNPLNRRFHAQPNACPHCGPVLWLEGENLPLPPLPAAPALEAMYNTRKKLYGIKEPVIMGNAAILALLHEIKKGRIAAIRGLGGFHLVCDACNTASVKELRRRKQRPHKALAVMVANVEQASHLAIIEEGAKKLLLSPARPIVICPRKKEGGLPDILAPDGADIGLMLPSTPLHYLLFHPEWAGGSKKNAPAALVMTSGNPHGAPICLSNREAKKRLSQIADLFLFHDRDILIRVDDSVIFPAAKNDAGVLQPELMVRRARGFVPTPLNLPPRPLRKAEDCVFAAGAELKHTFCLTRAEEAFVSQHIGDVRLAEHLSFFKETLSHLTHLLGAEPNIVVRDMHPDFLSSRLADDIAQKHGIRELSLQHHAAHVCAVMAEHGITKPVLGLALDGTGLGSDGTIWGGELLLVQPKSWQRLGRFSPFLLPGGEAAIQSPWRVAEALWREADLPNTPRPWLKNAPERARIAPMLREMMAQGIHCPQTSSCGRLFDAMAALCGLCFDISYEGQGAVRLENAQDMAEQGAYFLPIEEKHGLLEANVASLFQEAVRDAHNPKKLSKRFHNGLILGLARWARLAADKSGITYVALCGGVFNNRTLLACLPKELKRLGLTPLVPRLFPAGDGAVSLGQAMWGDWFLGE